MSTAVRDKLERLIIDVPDFPKKGILFKDLTTIFLDGEAMGEMIELFASRYRDQSIDTVVAVESRGFLFGAPLALKLGLGVALVRKHGKLPRETYQQRYDLEYGIDHMELHKDALKPGQRVVLIDDLLATGGTASAARSLVERTGATVIEAAFLVELPGLGGRAKLGCDCFSVLQYDGD